VPYLVWDSPQGRIVRELDRSVLILGRDEVSDFRIADATVARRHALLQVEGASIRLTDLGSRSGTKINGARLAPDVPSTLEPGDFVHVGGVVLSFHLTPPPAAAGVPLRPVRRAAPAPAAAKEIPWRAVAFVLAFLFVVLLGAFLGVLLGRDELGPEKTAAEETAEQPAPAEPETRPAPPSPLPERAPPPAPPEAREKGEATAEAAPATEKPPARAPAGALPPQVFASLKRCPDLLEVEHRSYYPVRVRDWNAAEVEAVGADGKLYAIPRGRVTRVLDRADLGRRVASKRARLAPDDADGRLALAGWCAPRFVRAEMRRLVEEVLRLRPGDEAAKKLQAALGEGE
jgi:pSer/pThr/pTyr-binding forkhead associated (FHA) protein